MGQSGTIALKSFQSFQVNDGLLAKVVEAVKAGEKEARSSGNIQSFEVFYKGFRQNIAIGKLYIIPAKIADKLEGFPVALLYGCLVKQFGGEEMADLISQKIGDSEYDEYSDADLVGIKDKLFKIDTGKFETLILFAPEWFNKREYVSFHFTKEDGPLVDRIRHLVFGAYYDPRLSSAFNALMTDVSTDKLDVTDITPKLPWPEISESPLKAFPVLHSEYVAGAKTAFNRNRIALTIKNADAITKEVLDPPEADVIEALDIAMTKALGGQSVNDAGKEHHTEAAGGGVPRYAAKEKAACESEHGVPAGVSNVGPGTAASDAKPNPEIKEKKFNADAAKDHESAQKPIGIELNADGTPKRKEASSKKAAAGEIHVANKAQAWLWECELTGQISDGMWENSSPMDHWQGITDATAIVGGEPGLVNVHPRRTYGFRRLVEYVGERMVNLGKLAKAYPDLEIKREYGYACEYIMDAKPVKAMAQHASQKTAGEIVLYNNTPPSDKEYRLEVVPAEGKPGLFNVLFKNGPRGKLPAQGKPKNPQPINQAAANALARQIADQKKKEGYNEPGQIQDVQKHNDLQIPEHAVKYVEALELATGDDRSEIRHKLESAPYTMGDLMRDLRQLEHIVNSGYRAGYASVQAAVKTASAKTARDQRTKYKGHDFLLSVWEERDRLNLNLTDETTGKEIIDVWDDDARQMFEDGFLNRRDLMGSMIEYAEEMGMLNDIVPAEEEEEMVEGSLNLMASTGWKGTYQVHNAESQRSRDKRAANERRLEKIRGKVADDNEGGSSVPDNDDILNEVLKDIGQAPLVDLPTDDGNENPSQPEPDGGISAMPQSDKSDSPEDTKAISDSQAQAVPTALENSATKHTEPAAAAPQESQEPKQEAPAEEPKTEEPKAEEPKEASDGAASATDFVKEIPQSQGSTTQTKEASAARKKVAEYIKKAAITVAQGEDEQGFHMLVTMNGREYVLRGDAADKFRQEYAAIKKPEAAVNQLVEKYMNELKPYKKQTIEHPTPVKEQAEGLADADNYFAGKGAPTPQENKRYMTQHASKTASDLSRKVASGSSFVLGRTEEWDLDLESLFSKTAAEGERHDNVPVSKGEGDNGEQPKSDLTGPAPEAHDVPPQVDSHEASDPTSSEGLFTELGHIAASIAKKAYVEHCPGHKNSEGNAAPWCIMQHTTGKILESFGSEQAAKDGLKNMESHKGSVDKAAHGCGAKCDKCGDVHGGDHKCSTAKKADAAPVLPGNLKHPESANVNAMREALETQQEMEVGKPIAEVQEEVQNAVADSGQEHVPGVGDVESKEIVIPKDEAGSRQVIINIAKQKVKETNAKMHTAAGITNDGAGGAMGGTDIDGHTPLISATGAAVPQMAPGAAAPRSLSIGELQALPVGRAAQFGEYEVTRQKPNFYAVTQGGVQVVSGNAAQVMKMVPQAQAPAAQGMVGSEDKEAGFNMYFPGQALREFYPEIQHEIVDYPNANNAPMIEDIDVTQGYDHDIAAALEDNLDTTKLAFVSTSPAGGAGIGRDGKPEVLEGAPLRKENDIRGGMFMDEFYQNYDAGPEGSALTIVSKKVAAADEAGQFGDFLIKVCGEIAAALVSGFKVTSRPLMDKIPGVGEVQLAQVEKSQPGFMPLDQTIVDPASRVKYLLEKLTDSEIQDAINGAYAHSGVWHDEAKGGFVYEIFVRATSIDTDTMVMKYEFVCGTKEAE